MKITLILLLIFISSHVKADFNDALINYENKHYTAAFNEFNRLARIGNKRAQFNLAVMYLNGQAVNQDLKKAYAWGKLSENDEYPEFSQIAKQLTEQFNTEELNQAKLAFETINQQFGDAQIYTQLSPIEYQSPDTRSTEFTLKTINRKAPRFPKEALSKGIQGWVTVGFEIFPDGSARHPYVIESFPEGIFDEVSTDVIHYFKFAISYSEDVEPFSIEARQTIEFELNLSDTKRNKLKEIYAKRLDNLKSLADQGSASAQYTYALAASSNLINEDNKIKPSEVNEWLLKSAQNGHVEAQYYLGRNIFRGQGCQIEKQKGIDWIVYAAEQGHPKSAKLVHKLLTQHNNLNNTDKPAVYWLQQSAEGGNADSQLDYAEYLINQDTVNPDNIQLARNYLNSSAQHRKKSYQWYLVSSQIYRQEGNSKKAISQLKKANKLAKKYGWNTWPLS